jgi:tetratricopeptide (TPR) repeat protein
VAPPPTAKSPAAAEEIPSRPPDFDFQEILGQAWNAANQGRLDESARLCAQARAAQPLSPDSYYLSAILALAQGAAEVARDELRRVLYLAPDFVLAYPMLTELYSTAQDDAAAERYCRQGLTHARSLPPELRVSAYGTTTAREITAHLEQLASQLEPPNSQG